VDKRNNPERSISGSDCGNRQVNFRRWRSIRPIRSTVFMHSECRNRVGFNIKREPTKEPEPEVPKSEHPKSRSESGPSISKDMWRQILHFRDLALWEICEALEKELPEVSKVEVRSNERLPRHFGPVLLRENFMPHSPKLLKPEVSKHMSKLISHDMWHTHHTHHDTWHSFQVIWLCHSPIST
jgi:hypothetical protein